MGRRSRRCEREPKYLPGATWRDVLRGAPVTETERVRNGQPRPVYRCRDCPNIWTPVRTPSKPRCTACGGIMDLQPAE